MRIWPDQGGKNEYGFTALNTITGTLLLHLQLQLPVIEQQMFNLLEMDFVLDMMEVSITVELDLVCDIPA